MPRRNRLVSQLDSKVAYLKAKEESAFQLSKTASIKARRLCCQRKLLENYRKEVLR